MEFDTRVDQISGGCYIYYDDESLANGFEVPFIEQYRMNGNNCRTALAVPRSTAALAVPPTPFLLSFIPEKGMWFLLHGSLEFLVSF